MTRKHIKKFSVMKKVVLALSFLFVLGLVSVNAQDKKKEVKKAPAKTEVAAPAKTAEKPAKKADAKPAKKGAVKPATEVKK